MKKPWNIAMLLVPVMLLVGCNTTAGAGRDIKSVGEELTETAEELK